MWSSLFFHSFSLVSLSSGWGGAFIKRGYELLVKWWIVIVCASCLFYVLHIHWLLYTFCFVLFQCLNGTPRLFSLLVVVVVSHPPTQSWENVMCYWSIFIQIDCSENMNSAPRLINDHVWVYICLIERSSICLITCVVGGRARKCVPMHLWLCTIFCTFLRHNYWYWYRLLIFLSFFLFFVPLKHRRIENKSNGIE